MSSTQTITTERTAEKWVDRRVQSKQTPKHKLGNRTNRWSKVQEDARCPSSKSSSTAFKLRRRLTWRLYFCWVLWFECKYLVHVSSSEKSLCSFHIATFWAVCKFFGDFWVYLGINSFSQRISKIYGSRKFWRFDVLLKLECEVRNWETYTKQLPTNPGCPFGGNQLSGGVPYPFFSLLIPL